MQAQGRPFRRAGSALALVLVALPLLAACTPGGQFDPTEMFNSDVFDAKKKLSGQRVPVFPDGVPGTTTGVPADLVKGYQPPPDPSDADASQTPPPPAGAAEAPAKTASAAAAPVAEAKPKPKPRRKPKVASAPAGQTQNSVWNRAQPGPVKGGPTRINVGSSAAPGQSGGQDQNAAAATNWPAPAPAPPPASNAAQTNWPAPQSSNAAQANWPAPASNSPAQRIQEDWPSSSSNASAPKTAQ